MNFEERLNNALNGMLNDLLTMVDDKKDNTYPSNQDIPFYIVKEGNNVVHITLNDFKRMFNEFIDDVAKMYKQSDYHKKTTNKKTNNTKEHK